MFTLKSMVTAAAEPNLESHQQDDGAKAFVTGYEAGMMDAQVEQGFSLLSEACDDMDNMSEARAIVASNLESGTVTNELQEAYQSVMYRMEGKYGITGLGDVNLESGEAVKGFLKNLAAGAAQIIAKITAMAKKVWLNFSAWLATSDDKVKSLKKKLEKAKEEGKEFRIKGEKKADQFATIVAKAELVVPSESLIYQGDDKFKTDGLKPSDAKTAVEAALAGELDTNAIAENGKLGYARLNLPVEKLDISNEKDEFLLKDKNTITYLVGMTTTSFSVLAINTEFTPEDSTEDPFYVAKLISFNREVDIEGDLDKTKEDLFGKTNIDADEEVNVKKDDLHVEKVITLCNTLPKAKDLQNSIKKGFKGLDKTAKAVEKTFGKVDDWEGKGKAAAAKKTAYVAASRALYSNVKWKLDVYRSTLAIVEFVAGNLSKPTETK